MTMRVALITSWVTALVSACASSGQTGGDAAGLSDYQQSMVAESIALEREADTTYKRRMLDLVRRSLLVPTDSLARLYVAIPATPVSELWRIRQAFGCEGFRLARTYGGIAVTRAEARLTDSLERGGLDIDRLIKSYLGAPGPLLTIHQSTCGEAVFRLPTLPDSLKDKPWPARFQVGPRPPDP